MYLLDTNVCLDFAKARSETLRTRVREQGGKGMAISTVTLGELRLGAQRSDAAADDERTLTIFVGLLGLRPFDVAAAEAYGRLAGRVKLGRNSFDRLIAAHALALEAVLVTNDERDFADIPGLRVENWTR